MVLGFKVLIKQFVVFKQLLQSWKHKWTIFFINTIFCDFTSKIWNKNANILVRSSCEILKIEQVTFLFRFFTWSSRFQISKTKLILTSIQLSIHIYLNISNLNFFSNISPTSKGMCFWHQQLLNSAHYYIILMAHTSRLEPLGVVGEEEKCKLGSSF